MKPQATPALALIPNVGAEEGADWPSLQAIPAVATTVNLWRGLFAKDHDLLGVNTQVDAPWPLCLGPRPSGAAFPWLDGASIACWLGDATAQTLAQEAGCEWAGPSPEAVRQTHDKAFTVRTSQDLDLTPRELRGLGEIFEPETLHQPDWIDRLEEELSSWPAWTQGQFCLKPRLGSSGRGHLRGAAQNLDRAELIAQATHLIARGGAVLEPWLDRRGDFSVQLHIPASERADAAPVTILGSLELWVTSAGLYRGHLGEVDSRGRIFSGGPYEEIAREAAAALSTRAREHGYTGPCGVDGLAFYRPAEGSEPGSTRVRPAVEFNARFTLGTVVIGWVRRHLDLVKKELGLRSGERRAFLFGLDTPPGFSDWESLGASLGPSSYLLPLADPATRPRPALLFTGSIETLREVLAVDPG